ncbi:hypothetical protein QAD02_019854 [Eretmocerus hayati]|uniref:Uncharacterized protein n=1 Tax=Eretmocerus hayati TaxID=131215 RepID=A0ACC2PKT1_9HYME|nr:hypothetical protein QAD02_019854 [Eretmocerus hayati]
MKKSLVTNVKVYCEPSKMCGRTQTTLRECISDSECTGIKDATCLEDIFGIGGGDQKKRCLCGDYKGPANGRCSNESKRVKALCAHNDECTEGAICALGNDTSVIGKRCWCTQSYMEDVDKLCSGSPVALGFSALSVVAGLLLTGNV